MDREVRMSSSTQQWMRVVIIAIAPIVFIVGVAILPYQERFTDFAKTAELASANGDRWLLAAIVMAAALWLFALAVVSIRHWLREAGENRWSFIAVPFALAGFTLFTFMIGAQGLGLRMAIEAGANGETFLNQAENWIMAVQLGGAILIAIGTLALILAFHRAHVFSRNRFGVIAIALVVAAVTNYLPFGAALWVGAIALLIAFWGISQQMMMQVRQPSMSGEGMAPQEPSPA
jgi:hypothetical protein